MRRVFLPLVERRLQVKTVPDLPTYRDYLATHPEETRLLLQDLCDQPHIELLVKYPG